MTMNKADHYSELRVWMSVAHCYVQLVNELTTDRATLIDRVYCFVADKCKSDLRDVYYSVHDDVYFSVPLYLQGNV